MDKEIASALIASLGLPLPKTEFQRRRLATYLQQGNGYGGATPKDRAHTFLRLCNKWLGRQVDLRNRDTPERGVVIGVIPFTVSELSFYARRGSLREEGNYFGLQVRTKKAACATVTIALATIWWKEGNTDT